MVCLSGTLNHHILIYQLSVPSFIKWKIHGREREKSPSPRDVQINILSSTCGSWIGVLGNVAAATTAGGVSLAGQDWGVVGYGVEVGDCASDVS